LSRTVMRLPMTMLAMGVMTGVFATSDCSSCSDQAALVTVVIGMIGALLAETKIQHEILVQGLYMYFNMIEVCYGRYIT